MCAHSAATIIIFMSFVCVRIENGIFETSLVRTTSQNRLNISFIEHYKFTAQNNLCAIFCSRIYKNIDIDAKANRSHQIAIDDVIQEEGARTHALTHPKKLDYFYKIIINIYCDSSEQAMVKLCGIKVVYAYANASARALAAFIYCAKSIFDRQSHLEHS